VGYARAGFDVVGVDSDPRALASYPFPCVLADVWDVLLDMRVDVDSLLPPARDVELVNGRLPLDEFDVIHASPPCQEYSITRNDHGREYPRDVERLVDYFAAVWTRPYVIENVPGAPMPGALLVCGSEFPLVAFDHDGRDLRLRRHRLFLSNVPLRRHDVCRCAEDRRRNRIGGVYGGGSPDRSRDNPRKSRGGYTPEPSVRFALMGVDWPMSVDQLSEAIPPIYTEHVGTQILAAMERPSACVECGNDDPTEGSVLCLDCLEAGLVS
jgi:DNA (cytosine-5)-methyltransferase 1